MICLELVFLIFVFSSLFIISTYKYEGATETIADAVRKNVADIQTGDIVITVLILLCISLFFGYVIAYIALKPTRDTLSSQKQFIGNIAHELRTPLSIIKTNIEVTLMDRGLDAKLRESLSDNIDELDRTSDTINNLLSFNTLQNPEEIPFGNINLGNVVDEVIEKLSPLAKEKGINMSLQKGEFLTVWGNAAALEQIAMNIIKNALVYTENDGEIAISLAPNYRGYIELSVSDTGIGIAHDELLRVFEPFYRAEQSRARRHGGSGLGLTIVSELVKLHSGKIGIKSKANHGTIVLIALPCGHVETALPIEESDDDVIARDYSKHRGPARKKHLHPGK